MDFTTAAATATFTMKFHFVGAAVAFMALAVITFEVAEAMEVFNDAPTVAEDNYAEVENVGEEDNDDFLENDVHLFETKGQSVRFKEATYEEFNIMCYKGRCSSRIDFFK